MAVRNCAEIGENLQKIVKRLMANDDLVKLLYYTDKDPCANEALTEEQKQTEVFEKLIRVTPRVGPKENATSLLVVTVDRGVPNGENSEFRDIYLKVEIFVPLTQWLIKGTNLRPFAILGEVQKSLNNKTVNGLGKIIGGSFEVGFYTEEMACYIQNYRITTYD